MPSIRTSPPAILLLAPLLLALPACGGASAEAETVEWRLRNGMRVTLVAAGPDAAERPGARAAVALFFPIGDVHDPEGRSGLAHTIEHLLVTAAAAEGSPARTADEWFAAHGGLANAQTGRASTLLCGVVEPSGLDAELFDWAARLRTLRVEASDLARELPRVTAELANMYGGMGALAAQNHGQNAIDPLPAAGRKGGVAAQLADLTPEEVNARLDGHYTPDRAHLVVTGAFDSDAVRTRIEVLFGGIPSREAQPLEVRTPAPSAPGTRIDLPLGPDRVRMLSVVWRAPELSDPDHPACLHLGARLLQAGRAHGVTPLFAPLDNPRVIGVSTQIAPDGSVARAQARIDAALDACLSAKGEGAVALTTSMLDRLFLLSDTPETVLVGNPYLVALSAGRKEGWGIDGDVLLERLGAVTDEDLTRVRAARFTAERGVTVVVGAGAEREREEED